MLVGEMPSIALTMCMIVSIIENLGIARGIRGRGGGGGGAGIALAKTHVVKTGKGKDSQAGFHRVPLCAGNGGLSH